MVDYTVITAQQRPDLIDVMHDLLASACPTFMLNETVAQAHWPRLYTDFAALQIAFVTPDDTVIALANSFGFAWDGSFPDDGWDWALTQGMADYEAGIPPTTLCALSIAVSKAYRGQGLSREMVRVVKAIGVEAGLEGLIIPIRPILKPNYPLMPIDTYIKWRRADGLIYDPWLRVHERLGAEIVRGAPRAKRIEGTVSDWEQWADMCFPFSGDYIVPDALAPVTIDCTADRGLYIEPNVWIIHR